MKTHRHSTLTLLAVLIAVLTPGAISAAPEAMTRDAIIELAQSGVDYSYYWGHGNWRSDGTELGSCSGSCPDCTHSGSYGADCSGFVAKVWQVPGPSPVTTNAHPYSTRNFRYSETHWDRIDRADAVRADAFVYRNSTNTGGHVVLFESGDPWGQLWTYEARGCSPGIVRNLRTLSSSYVAIRRHNLSSAPSTGTLKGVIFVDRGEGTADMSERIPGAQVALDSSTSATARDGDAQWSATLAPGSYQATASASGYLPTTRSCEVSAGTETWCSVGLTPVCEPDCSGRSCGPDPLCGSSCGSCTGDDSCDAAGQCAAPACEPDCSGRSCGADPVCGSSCGSCGNGELCGDDGQCALPTCTPDCSGLSCGPDPVCGVSCGSCGEGEACLNGSCAALPAGLDPLPERGSGTGTPRSTYVGEGVGCSSAPLPAAGFAWLLLGLCWRRRRN